LFSMLYAGQCPASSPTSPTFELPTSLTTHTRASDRPRRGLEH
jgi:hypothetical protein